MRRCGHRQRGATKAETILCTHTALDGVKLCDAHARAAREYHAKKVQGLTRAIMLAATGGRHGA